jgi:hypothetical protein
LTDVTPLANLGRYARLPVFRQLTQRRALMASVLVVPVAVATVGAGLLAARPVTEHIDRPESHNRDVVLCLDVSGSMIDWDTEIADTFAQMVEEFDGERVGMSVFNATSVTLFPLTDDYAFLAESLKDLSKGLQDLADGNWEEAFDPIGTMNAEGSSLIGDGLATCTQLFDRADSKRARSIVLATDNEVQGEQLITLSQAAQYAADMNIRIYGLDPLAGFGFAESGEFEDAMQLTDGGYYGLDDGQAVSAIVDAISAQEEALLMGAPITVRADKPGPATAITTIAVGAALLLVIALRVAAVNRARRVEHGGRP